MSEEQMMELTEEDLRQLYASLKKYRDSLKTASVDRDRINTLMVHVEDRLKEIAWQKYKEEKIPEIKEV